MKRIRKKDLISLCVNAIYVMQLREGIKKIANCETWYNDKFNLLFIFNMKQAYCKV